MLATFHHLCKGPITSSMGKTTGLCAEGPDPTPGSARNPQYPRFHQLGWARVAQQPGKTLCSHSELKTTSAAASCPCSGAHPQPRAACPRPWQGFGAQAGRGSCSRTVLQPASHPCTEQERERAGGKREGKDVSNQSYLNKSLFGPRALLKAAYLIKSPIFHIYGPYSVKY